MRCRSVLTRVDALRTGELGAADAGEVHKHIENCPSCNESVADVTTLADTVKSVFSATPPRSCRDAVKGTCADSFDDISESGERVWVAFSDRGLRLVYRGGSESDLRALYAKAHGRTLERGKLPEKLRKQVISALRGEGVDKPQVDWGDSKTDLERKVLDTLTRIPRGEVRTYAWLAAQVGHPRAVRAVGNIVAKNFVPFVLPCHRVVPTSGGVGKYAFGTPLKREILRREGVDVDALDALARAGIRYIGSKTTKVLCFPTCRDARRIREENRVPFHGAAEAVKKGFRPCRHCQPLS